MFKLIFFTPIEKAALEDLVSNEFIEKWQFKNGSHGDVLNENGESVF